VGNVGAQIMSSASGIGCYVVQPMYVRKTGNAVSTKSGKRRLGVITNDLRYT
jgi:hypothetical protein